MMEKLSRSNILKRIICILIVSVMVLIQTDILCVKAMSDKEDTVTATESIVVEKEEEEKMENTTVSSENGKTVMSNEAGGYKCGLCHICPTFLGICYFIWLVIILLVVIVIIWLIYRKRNNKAEDVE